MPKLPVPSDHSGYRKELGDRISQAIEKLPTKTSAALAMGVSPEQVNKWIKGTVKVPADALRALSLEAGVDFSWLVTGASVPPTSSEEGQFYPVPRFPDVRASAGWGSAIVNERKDAQIVAFSPIWLRDLGVNPRAASIIFANGDSMYPTIPHGSALLVDTSKKDIRNGCIYVFDIEGDLMVKRIERLPDGSVDMISDNKEFYPVRNLTTDRLSQLTIIGRVYSAVRSF
jgi:phage repressor protein C with HTH and peptisase S24 domain